MCIRDSDYIIPNNIVEDGQCDTNYFQHQPYLDDFNAEHGTHLVTVAGIHVAVSYTHLAALHPPPP